MLVEAYSKAGCHSKLGGDDKDLSNYNTGLGVEVGVGVREGCRMEGEDPPPSALAVHATTGQGPAHPA